MRFFFSVLALILVILLVISLGIGLLILWSAGLSWLLIKLLPFTLFEGAILVLLSTLFMLYAASRIFSDLPMPSNRPETSDEMLFAPDDDIPADRFWQKEDEKTNEAWFRYAIANELYEDLSDMELDNTLGKAQQKELAIRLSDIMVALLKERRFRKGTRRISITVPQLQAQMEKMGQRPYDLDILETAVSSVNIRLSYDEDLADIILDKTWDELEPGW